MHGYGRKYVGLSLRGDFLPQPGSEKEREREDQVPGKAWLLDVVLKL